ncbi:hypothetical protein D3C71_1376850 [compost metagenome]
MPAIAPPAAGIRKRCQGSRPRARDTIPWGTSPPPSSICVQPSNSRNTTVANAPASPINAAMHKVTGSLSASKPLLNRVAHPDFLILMSLAMAEFYGEFCSLFVQSPVKKAGGCPLECPVSTAPQRPF